MQNTKKGANMPLLKIIDKDRIIETAAEDGENLLQILRREKVYISAPCGGKGTCGKCLVRMESGGSARTVPACGISVAGDAVVKTLSDEDGFSITSAFMGEERFTGEASGGFGLAVDIGTTTVAICAVDLASGGTADVYTTVNRQREYGADVISRIEKCAGHLDDMSASIKNDILDGIRTLLGNGTVTAGKIGKIAVVGNSTMIGLFLGEDCTAMGKIPFTVPERVANGATLGFREHFGSDLLDCPVVTLPCVSAYIGADSVACALFLDLMDHPGFNIIADVGTNGEILLFDGQSLLCASTAAGPALEGGNITCGMGGTGGAISKFRYSNGEYEYETIQNKPPVGICGSGVIDITAELLANGIIDETGLFADEGEIAVCGGIVFNQKDVRQVQLAKSAIKAGIYSLLNVAGLEPEDIGKLYLAGGFGTNADLDNAVAIGLLPGNMRNSIVSAGNAALGGAVRFLCDENAADKVDRIIKLAKEVSLGSDPYFSEAFMEFMGFE